jgi:hypothetical protein
MAGAGSLVRTVPSAERLATIAEFGIPSRDTLPI